MINYPKHFQTRRPAVAGTFYPSDPKELNEKIDNLLRQALFSPTEKKMQILLVPHAGIDYSGTVAAAGFKQIKEKDYSKIIILGVSHHQWFNHAAVFPPGFWETPLGTTEIDETLVTSLIDNNQLLFDSVPHENEHSLEVELIFLQKILKNFRIAPVLISQADNHLINRLAEKISAVFDDQTLLVISSDLSHYPNYEVATAVDQEIVNSILSGKNNLFEQTLSAIKSKNYPNLDTCACGEKAIMVGLKIAENLKITDFKLFKYENSGDITEDKSRVVGYAAIGGYGETLSTTQALDNDAQIEALKIARQTLEQYLSGQPLPMFSPTSPFLQKPLGAFVTLKKHGEIRGCIGIFETKEPLFQTIKKMAIAAATQDSRFPPVTADELKDIIIEISVLTAPTRVENWQKIELGKHGVIVRKGTQTGIFLPQVAKETGWTLEEFLSQLCSQKAGLPETCYKDSSTDLYIFEAQVFEEK